MRVARIGLLIVLVSVSVIAAGQPPQATQPPPQPGQPGAQRGAQPPDPGGRGRGGRGRGAVQVMTLTTPAWTDGGQIPIKYTQAGDQVSPPLSWSAPPDGVASYTLLFHDVDAATGNGTDDMLHWALWNIPATATSVPEGVPQGSPLADGTRQMSVSGPYYRGPGAAASGPAHHYVLELFALDTMLDVPSVPPAGTSVAQHRAAIVAAMAGHVRGKAVYVGLFKRSAITDR